ncbi:MAG TPA: four helix bundle protein, partial [Desulfatiglandales bacterium]|nr:four helix bundle protein [Desulfatiglandales bacterium]
MKIERFEDIEAWQPAESLQVERLARELTRKVYRLTKKPGFANDYRLNRQIQDAAGLSIGEFSVHRSGFLVAGTLRFCMFSTLNLERRTQEPRTSTYRPTNLKMFTNRPT